MVLLANGDVTESFFHLSSDQSEHLSSGDDLSVHTSDNLSNFLRLAKEHDMNVTRGNQTRNFSGDERSYTSENEYTSSRGENDMVQTPFDHFKRHVSDTVLASKSSQPHHFFERHASARRSQHKHHEAHDKIERNSENNGNIETNENDANDANSTLEENFTFRKESSEGDVKELDMELLFRAFELLLDKYFKSRRKEISKPKTRANEIPDSEPDSAIDDTFGRPRIPGFRPAKLEHSSPITSPPQSSGDSQFMFDKSTEVEESDICRQILPQPSKASGAAASKHNARRPPQLELGDLTSDEIDFDWKSGRNVEKVEINDDESQEETLESLRTKVEQYKKDNDGMQNEIAYLRSKLEALSSDKKEEEHISRYKNSNTRITMDETETQNSSCNEFEANLPQQFRPYYQSLQLYKFDELSHDQLRIVIKNLMLSLLVSDFDHLSEMAPRVGAYLRITLSFLDALHERLYSDEEMKPSRYLRNYNIDINKGFQECLDGMMKLVVESTNETL